VYNLGQAMWKIGELMQAMDLPRKGDWQWDQTRAAAIGEYKACTLRRICRRIPCDRRRPDRSTVSVVLQRLRSGEVGAGSARLRDSSSAAANCGEDGSGNAAATM
jgi:hypothetical protein